MVGDGVEDLAAEVFGGLVGLLRGGGCLLRLLYSGYYLRTGGRARCFDTGLAGGFDGEFGLFPADDAAEGGHAGDGTGGALGGFFAAFLALRGLDGFGGGGEFGGFLGGNLAVADVGGDLGLGGFGGGAFGGFLGLLLGALLVGGDLLLEHGLGLLHVIELRLLGGDAGLDHNDLGLANLLLELAVGLFDAAVLELEIVLVAADAGLHAVHGLEQAGEAGFVAAGTDGGAVTSPTLAALLLDGLEGGVDAVVDLVAVGLGELDAVEFALDFAELVEDLIKVSALADARFQVLEQRVKGADVLLGFDGVLGVEVLAHFLERGEGLVDALADVVTLLAQEGFVLELALDLLPELLGLVPEVGGILAGALDAVFDLGQFALVGLGEFFAEDMVVPLGLGAEDHVRLLGLQVVGQEAFGDAEFAGDGAVGLGEFGLLALAPLVHEALVHFVGDVFFGVGLDADDVVGDL